MTLPIGSTIRAFRMDQQLTINEVAARIPTPKSYWCEIETGRKTPSIPMLERIANSLDLETAELWFAIYENMGAK
jgi:transcriptional regulator with XRE-family HTH domain